MVVTQTVVKRIAIGGATVSALALGVTGVVISVTHPVDDSAPTTRNIAEQIFSQTHVLDSGAEAIQAQIASSPQEFFTGVLPGDTAEISTDSVSVVKETVADFDGNGVTDTLQLLEVTDGEDKQVVATVALRSWTEAPLVVDSAFVGTNLDIDSLTAEEAEAKFSGWASTSTDASAHEDGGEYSTDFAATVALTGDASSKSVSVVLEPGTTISDEHPVAKTGPIQELNLAEGESSATVTLGETATFGCPQEIRTNVPDNHVLTLSGVALSDDSNVTVTAVNENGETIPIGSDGVVDATGKVRIIAASDRASMAEVDLTATIEKTAAPAQPPVQAGRPTHDETGKPILYFTFDDGPGPFTPQVLDILAANNAHGTFFMVGPYAANDPAMVDRVRSGGHAIGNHSWNHPQFTTLSSANVVSEIESTDQHIGGSKCVRPPYGDTNGQVAATISSLGKSQTMWDIDTLDWTKPGSDQLVSTIVDSARPGSIVLMHDGGAGREQTVAALSEVLPALADQGYVFHALPECG